MTRRKREPLTVQLVVRLPQRLADKLEGLAQARHTTRGAMVRRLISRSRAAEAGR